MTITSDHIQIISSSPTGATIATDYHAGTQRHWQVVKLNVGLDGTDSLLSNDNALPVYFSDIDTAGYLPVSGNTAGTASVECFVSGGNISADLAGLTLTVGDLTIIGGTLDAVTLIGGTMGQFKGGASLDVINTITTITNDVGITAPPLHVASGTVGVQSVAIPLMPVFGHVTAGTGVTWLNESASFNSGVRITNNGPDAVYIGTTSVTLNTGYKLASLDSIFLEVSGSTNIGLIRAAGNSSDVRYIGS